MFIDCVYKIARKVDRSPRDSAIRELLRKGVTYREIKRQLRVGNPVIARVARGL